MDGGKAELEGRADVTIAFDQVVYAPLYRTPTKIIGIGLNYAAAAGTIGCLLYTSTVYLGGNGIPVGDDRAFVRPGRDHVARHPRHDFRME